MMAFHDKIRKPGYIVLIVLTLVFMIITLLFNIFNGFDKKTRMDMGLFQRESDWEMFIKHPLPIDLATWSANIWNVIYVLQIVWMIYTQTLICRRSKFNTGPLYCNPPFLPPAFYFIYMMGLILNVTLLFCIDSLFIAATFVALAGIVICLSICLFFSFKLLWDYENELCKHDMWANIIMVQNFIGFYLIWIFVSTIINFARVLKYKTDVSINTACYIVLVLALAIFLIYFFTDILIFSTRFRYFLTPYIGIIIAFAAIVSHSWSSDNGVQIFAVVILAITAIGLICKLVSIVYYARKKPLSIEK